MRFDSDVALLGTGVAPLIAARKLLAQGKSVLVLNPDFDFFLEDSELPLEPLIPHLKRVYPDHLKRNLPDQVLAALRPGFPGAVESLNLGVSSGSVTGSASGAGFRDLKAPHVRSRSLLWLASNAQTWERLEDSFVELSDAGMSPQIFEGVGAARKFPGVASSRNEYRALGVPKFCDVDVSRYRNGILEFVRERLGSERLVSNATQLELMPGGVRFHAEGQARTASLQEGLLVFWTPRLTSWILGQAKRRELPSVLPLGVRLWEQWKLLSRDPLDPQTVGVFEDLAAWAEIEGSPEANSPQHADRLHQLSVLRAGPRLRLDSLTFAENAQWASQESFSALSRLCLDFMGWDRFTVRSLRTRAILEWEEGLSSWKFPSSELRVEMVPFSDGPLPQVVKAAGDACDRLEQSGGLG